MVHLEPGKGDVVLPQTAVFAFLSGPASDLFPRRSVHQRDATSLWSFLALACKIEMKSTKWT